MRQREKRWGKGVWNNANVVVVSIVFASGGAVGQTVFVFVSMRMFAVFVSMFGQCLKLLQCHGAEYVPVAMGV